MEYKLFYDTNALLNLQEKAFQEQFFISQKSLEEIEHIKTSATKDNDIKYRARRIARLLNQFSDSNIVNVIKIDSYVLSLLNVFELQDTPDNIILACAKAVDMNVEHIIVCTDDLNCKFISKRIFELNTVGIDELDFIKNTNEYTGFKEISMSDEDMAYVYEHANENKYELLINEYLIIKNLNNEVVDALRWDGEKHQPLSKSIKKTLYFEKLKAKDIYQSCAIDSLNTNTITAISGKAGSGKSLLSLLVCMGLVESGKYDRIVVLFNPTKVRGASDMGFYGGDFLDKAMQNFIGQILTTKFGDRYAVDMLLQNNKLKLVSMADCRGMEILDNEILWITESQNTSVDLIKLCLSRVSSGAKVIIEGDYESQVDSFAFEGEKNGLKRVIDCFKDHEEFGFVQLQNCWRSRIATLCELL